MISRLLAEAKRRHVFRTAGLYAGGAFAILQTADIALPALGISDSVISYLLLLIAAGFPLALIAAWFFDISREGIAVTREAAAERRLSGAKLVDGIIVLLALGVGIMYLERFTGDAALVVPTESASVTNESTPPPITLEPSIAVLPFENLSASQDNAYFAAGIHEDILNDLSKVSELIVTSRTSTLAYAGSTKPIPVIADELGVNYVIEGSVRRAGDRVRISVQLIEAASDKHIWSEAYERAVIDVFEVQQQIASEVSHALRVQFDIGLADGEYPTKSLEAYELFLEARSLYNTFEPDGIATAISNYRQALEIDPDYTDAWAGLALALNSTLFFGRADREFEEAKVAADKALTLSPDSWMANYAKAMVVGANGAGMARESLPYFERAIEINPNDGNMLAEYGFNLWFSGDARAAMEQFLGAYRRNPLSASANMSRAMVAFFEGDNLTSEKFIRRAIDIEPDSTYINWWAGAALNSMNNPEAAAHQFGRVLELNPDHLGAMNWLSTVFTILGDYDSANYWLDRCEAIAPSSPAYFLRRANNFALGGEVEEYQAHVANWLRVDPGNRDALRYKSYATARAVRKAWDAENATLFRELSRRALDEAMVVIELKPGSKTDYRVNFGDSWLILAAAVHAKNLGESELVGNLLNSIIEFHESQPPGSFSGRNLQMMLAHSLMDDRETAISYARKMNEDNFRSFWLLNTASYDVVHDVFGIYGGVNEDVAFKNVIAEMNAANRASLERLRTELPEIFPPRG